MTLPEMFRQIDRRVIFLLIALAVAIPLILKPRFPDRASPIVLAVYDRIESLPAGSRVLLGFDYEPGGAPELDPMATAVLRHCIKKGLKMYIITLWPAGPGQISRVTGQVFDREFPEKQYDVDYVNLGYKAGGVGAINTMVANFRTLFPTDARGTPVDSLTMMDGVSTLRDFAVIISFSVGDPGLKQWVQFAGDVVRVPIMGGSTAVIAPEMYAYYPRQLVGLMGGLKGAAEYEAALVEGYPEFKDRSMAATVRMGPQVVAHTVIVLLIVLGNISFIVSRRKK